MSALSNRTLQLHSVSLETGSESLELLIRLLLEGCTNLKEVHILVLVIMQNTDNPDSFASVWLAHTLMKIMMKAQSARICVCLTEQTRLTVRTHNFRNQRK